jgi:hypothetical protein
VSLIPLESHLLTCKLLKKKVVAELSIANPNFSEIAFFDG